MQVNRLQACPHMDQNVAYSGNLYEWSEKEQVYYLQRLLQQYPVSASRCESTSD